MAKKNANFSFDARGWGKLRQHIANEIRTGHLATQLIELNLTGSRLKTYSDVQHFIQILHSFEELRMIILRGCGLTSLDFLADILCQKQLGCKCVDISGNELSQEKVKKFIECLEGRSHTRDVAPFFLAIGSGGQLCELLTPWSASCNPFAKHGCFCRSRKVVHVLDSLHRQPASALSKTRPQLPPPPEVPPPLPPTDIIQRSLELGQARETFAAALDEEREKGRTLLFEAIEVVLAIYDQKRYVLVDLSSSLAGLVTDISGAELQIDKLSTPAGEGSIIQAKAAAFDVAECSTPDVYLTTAAGDIIEFCLDAADERGGWVAARHASHTEAASWLWFPFSRLLVSAPV